MGGAVRAAAGQCVKLFPVRVSGTSCATAAAVQNTAAAPIGLLLFLLVLNNLGLDGLKTLQQPPTCTEFVIL